MSSHEQDTPAADLHARTQVQQLPEGTSSDDVNSTSPNFGTFTGPSVPGYPFLSQPQASGEIGRLGDYRVLAKLGEGGMGFVFRAEDPALKRFVALKVMRPEVAAKPLAADRFLREGRAAAGLKSDHIITIYQVGQANGAPFIAMEYLEGIALDEWMKQQKKAVPVPHVLRVVRDTLRGLATAHDKGLIHRDIKPANLWIEKGTARIKVLDFGLTRGMDGNDQMTADGAVVGTPAYMAPEQAAGKPVDLRADLFSVGTVMYQLFLGINPFVRSNMMATMGAVSFDVQPPVIALRPEVPQAYSDYLDRLLAKDPAGRPANAKAALAELAAIEKSLQDAAKTLASSSNIPVVSMMAPAAAPVPAQVWGDITDADDTVVRTSMSDPETPRKPPSNKLLIGSGLFAFFALILGGIVIVITNKDGTKTKVEVPDGATVEVQKDGKSVASVGGKKAEVAKKDAPKPKGVGKVTGPMVAATDLKPYPPRVPRSAFDDLDAAKIPAEERYPWQPKELVAVVGSSRGYFGGAVEHRTATVISPDGRWIVATGERGSAVLDAKTLRPVLQDTAQVWRPALAPDGKTAAISRGGDVRIYDLSGAEPKPLRNAAPTSENGVHGVAYLPDGKTLATSTGFGGVYLWDLTGPADVPKMVVHPASKGLDNVRQISASRDGTRLAAIGMHPEPVDRADVVVWDISGKESKELARVPIEINKHSSHSAALAHDGKTILVGVYGQDVNENRLELWDVSGPAKRLASEKQPGVRVLGLSADGQAMRTLCHEGLIVWSFADGKLARVKTVKGEGFVATTTDLSRIVRLEPSGMHFGVLDGDGKVLVNGGQHTANGDLRPVALGNLIFTTTGDIRPWTVRDGAFQPRPIAPELAKELSRGLMYGSLPSADGRRIAGIGPDAIVRILTVNAEGATLTSSLLHPLGSGPPAGQSISFAWTLDGKTIFTRQNTGAILDWDTVQNKPEPKLVLNETADQFPQVALVVHPAGRLLADRVNNTIRLTIAGERPAERRIEPPEHDGSLENLTFTPDGRYLLANYKHRIWRFDLTKAELPGEPWSDAEIDRYWLSPDGRTIVALDLSTRRWRWLNSTTMKPLGGFELPATNFGSASFAPDGRHFLVEQMGCVYVLRLGLPPDPNAAADPDRKAAEFVIGKGGYVVVLNPGKEVTTKEVKDLPKEPFQLRDIVLRVEAPDGITDADLDQFRELDSLDTLDMFAPNTVTDAGLAKLAGFPFAVKLRTLYISGDELTDAAFASAAKFTSLNGLLLQSKRITGSGIAHLKASSIGGLVISQCRLVDAEMVHLKAMPNLNSLQIIGTPIGDAGLKHISEVKQLSTLQMQNCVNVTIAGMKHLEKCEALQLIELSSPMTGACFESLGKIKTIAIISTTIEVTDTDVKHLVGLPKFENLRCNLLSLTDVGLESLSQIKTLKFIYLKGSKVTAAGVKKFRAALPECKVESDFPE